MRAVKVIVPTQTVVVEHASTTASVSASALAAKARPDTGSSRRGEEASGARSAGRKTTCTVREASRPPATTLTRKLPG